MSQFELHPKILQEISAMAARMREEGRLLSEERRQRQIQAFRARFGPERLAALDDDGLLEQMHRAEKDSLTYWLEFKNDDEFSSSEFGSISGGSALKFSIFYRRQTGQWMGRDRSNEPVEITKREAVVWARRQRDQLLAGVELLQRLPKGAGAGDYQALQAGMDARAAEVSNLSWGHKYFSVLFPNTLDCFHRPELQRFHLVKLLAMPPEGSGRYTLAGVFNGVASQTGLLLPELATVLNERNGRIHSYWRVGTTDAEQSYWPAMRDGNYVAVGWSQLGDLTTLLSSDDPREGLKRLLAERYPNTASVTGRSATEILNFAKNLTAGDLVVAANGSTVLGVGRVDPGGDYRYEPPDAFPHRRGVLWLDTDQWPMPDPEALRSTFREIKKPVNLVALESQIVGTRSKEKPAVAAGEIVARASAPRLSGVPARIQEILERKGQVILFGPPGTGKSHWAEKTARELAARHGFGVPFDVLQEDRKALLVSGGFVKTCTFHPAYGYEDFLEGYRPQAVAGQMHYTMRDGVFKKLCWCSAAETVIELLSHRRRNQSRRYPTDFRGAPDPAREIETRARDLPGGQRRCLLRAAQRVSHRNDEHRRPFDRIARQGAPAALRLH